MFTFGMPVLNRTKLYEKRCAGMFISTVPFAISFSDEMKIIDFLKLITMTHTKYFRHQQYPYHDILGNLRKKYGFGERLYDVMISYQNAQVSSEIPFTTKWYSNGYSEVPLEMHIDDRDRTGNFQLTFDYQKGVFPEESEVVLLCERIIWLLQQMIHSDGKSIAALSIMPPYEEHRILHDFHKFFTDRYASKCVHEIFMAQAERTPEAAAVIYEGKVYTYRQIDEMSNAIAHELKNRGITANCVVPVIAHRSHYVIVAMLGVLKAGGAYLPIDPEYPKDRINYMLSEAGADYILTYHDDAVYDNIQRIDLESFSYEDLSSVPSV
ncbi:AMP-binding protein, partial [Eisenbergiella tayi]|uniref:AMP-binding protein n=1 Tax=Eisenbergiella tayi TaxID=1432052 RepID=UPI002A83D596